LDGCAGCDASRAQDQQFIGTRMAEGGCWQHARSKFEAAAPGAPLEAAQALAYIGVLFDIETEADEAGDSLAERLSRRRRESGPLLSAFEE